MHHIIQQHFNIGIMGALSSHLNRNTIGTIGWKFALATERAHGQKPSLIAVVVHYVHQRRGVGHCWCHWSCKHRGFKDPLQGTMQVKSRLASRASPIHPETYFTLEIRRAAHMPDREDFNTTVRNNNKMHVSPYFQQWVSQHRGKPPPSHFQKLHMEERKVPGFLQCKILLRNRHPNSQSSFECPWVWEGAREEGNPKACTEQKSREGLLWCNSSSLKALDLTPIFKASFFTRVENMDVGIGLHCDDC